MTIFNDEDFMLGAITGLILHTIMWYTRIQLATFSCINECESLLFFDIPASMFYFFFGDTLKIILSFTLGGLSWALGGWFGIKLVRYGWDIYLKTSKKKTI